MNNNLLKKLLCNILEAEKDYVGHGADDNVIVKTTLILTKNEIDKIEELYSSLSEFQPNPIKLGIF